jgi:hypothetical protein
VRKTEERIQNTEEIEHRTFNIERRIEEMLNTEKERRVGQSPTLQENDELGNQNEESMTNDE